MFRRSFLRHVQGETLDISIYDTAFMYEILFT